MPRVFICAQGLNIHPSRLDTGIALETSTCIANPELDITGPERQPDCKVDLYEFADIASQWLDCYLIPSSGCP